MASDTDRRVQLGRIAFEAYRDEVGGLSVTGTPIPDWEDLGDRIRLGWCAAAEAVEDADVA